MKEIDLLPAWYASRGVWGVRKIIHKGFPLVLLALGMLVALSLRMGVPEESSGASMRLFVPNDNHPGASASFGVVGSGSDYSDVSGVQAGNKWIRPDNSSGMNERSKVDIVESFRKGGS